DMINIGVKWSGEFLNIFSKLVPDIVSIDWGAIANTIGEVLDTVIGFVAEWGGKFIGGFQEKWTQVTGITMEKVNTVKNTILEGFNAAAQFVQDAMSTANGYWDAGWETIKSTLGAVTQAGKDLFNGFKRGVIDVWNTLVSWFLEIPGKIKGFFTGAPSWLWQ